MFHFTLVWTIQTVRFCPSKSDYIYRNICMISWNTQCAMFTQNFHRNWERRKKRINEERTNGSFSWKCVFVSTSIAIHNVLSLCMFWYYWKVFADSSNAVCGQWKKKDKVNKIESREQSTVFWVSWISKFCVAKFFLDSIISCCHWREREKKTARNGRKMMFINMLMMRWSYQIKLKSGCAISKLFWFYQKQNLFFSLDGALTKQRKIYDIINLIFR